MKYKLTILIHLVVYLIFCEVSLGQTCGSETYTILNQCPGQQPQVQINGAMISNVNYSWYDLTPGLLSLGNGYSVVYPAPLGASETFYYNKLISTTGGPTYSGTLAVSGNVPSSGDAFDVPYSSANSFKLNEITVAIRMYSCNPSSTYRLKVGNGMVYSQWHYFKCSDMINTSDGNVKLVRVPVMETATVQGITIPAGSGNIQIYTAADGTQATGTSPVDAFEWFPSSNYSGSYSVGGVTLNYTGSVATISGQANKAPGLYNWNITTICPAVTVNISPSSLGCCVPSNVNPVSITSSTGSNIIDVDPVSPAITLSVPLQTGFYYQWYKNGVAFGAPGTNVNSISVNTSGQYSVKVAENSSHINKASCVKENVMWIQKRILFAESDKTTICLGETVNLLAKGATGNVSWTPTSPTLINPTTATPTFVPTSAGTFTLNVTAEVPVGNQIINGDFEAGNVAINPSSYYFYRDATTATNSTPADAIGYPSRQALSIVVGNYTINNYVFWPGFQAWLPIEDHTTGSGKFLYVDAVANTNPGQSKFLWSQNVVVQPNTNYEFAAWVTNFNAEGDPGYVVPPGVSGITVNPSANPLPEIMLYINDAPAFASPPTLSATVGQWQKISTIWNSGSNSGTVTLKLSEIFSGFATGGHDFALDDISFGAPGNQTDDISLTVNDCYSITASASACTGDSVTLTANTNGIFQSWQNITSGSPTTVGIRSPNQSITKVLSETGVSTQFRATAKFIFGNMIPNADFAQFKSGFSATYTDANATSAMNPGQYIVGTLPTTMSTLFYRNVLDHTTGTAVPQYYVGDSRYDASRTVAYRVTVPVVNGVEYGFSGWFTNIMKEFDKATPDTTISAPYPNGAKTTRLDLFINNQFVRRIQLPTNNNWNNYSATWVANTTGNVNIELRSVNSVPFGSLNSGFAMDDLQFGAVYTVQKNVTVNTVPCVLPVTWLYVRYQNNQIEWATSSEKNASHYEIQVSDDAINFNPISTVLANGNTNSISKYDFYYNARNSTFIRIKQIDLDGKFDYSQIIDVTSDRTNLLIYPNPTSGITTLSFDKSDTIYPVIIEITSTTGSVVSKTSTNQSFIKIEGLSSGIYLVKVTLGSTVQTQKLIVE